MTKKNAVESPHIRMPVSASMAPTSRQSSGSTRSPYPVVVYVTQTEPAPVETVGWSAKPPRRFGRDRRSCAGLALKLPSSVNVSPARMDDYLQSLSWRGKLLAQVIEDIIDYDESSQIQYLTRDELLDLFKTMLHEYGEP